MIARKMKGNKMKVELRRDERGKPKVFGEA
jgi:hypothetical protein